MQFTIRMIAAGVLAVGLVALQPSALAQPQGSSGQAAAAPTGVKAEILRSIEDAEKKIIALAEKFPQEKYAWHPEGARPTSEAFMHIAAGNYTFATFMGTARPDGKTGAVLSKITDKAQVVQTLKESFAHIKAAIANASDLETPVKFFGRDTVVREVLIVSATHTHEHLGQLIAYARVNGIVPPWSEPK